MSALPGESLEYTLSQRRHPHLLLFHQVWYSEIQFLSCFIWHFVNPLISVGRLIAHCNPLAMRNEYSSNVVFSLGSSPTVDTENRARRLQPNINMSGSGSRFNGIDGTPNKTQQKLYFATILDVVNTVNAQLFFFFISRYTDHLRPEPCGLIRTDHGKPMNRCTTSYDCVLTSLKSRHCNFC